MADQDKLLLKDGLARPAVKRIADNLRAAEPSFDGAGFVRTAMRGLSSLELKARVMHVIGALHQHLPDDYPSALEILVRAGADWQSDPDDKLGGFAAWPIIDFVGQHGLQHPDESLEALRSLTRLFSAEFAIRPFIDDDQKRVLARLAEWTTDPNEHVRRLVSEGTRPRLPWGGRLRSLQQDPAPAVSLLDELKDDESEYVRRSVANHLNDIAKDHPDLVVKVCRRWSKGASAERRALIKHALRTLVKAGDPGALSLLGFDPKAKLSVEGLVLTPKRVKLGDDVKFRFELVSKAKKAQPLVIDYAVHHVKKSGERTAKVFKLKSLTLKPGERVELDKKHGIRKISTRRYHSGRHAVEILINGRSRAHAEFDLRVPD